MGKDKLAIVAKPSPLGKAERVKKVGVIPSQCAHWRGNPPVLPESAKNGQTP